MAWYHTGVQAPPEGLSFTHEEVQTGGSKHPTRIHLRAHTPEDGQVGALLYYPPKRKNGRIAVDNLHVEPDQRRRGIASALMDEMQRRHPEASIDHGDRTNNGEDWWKGYTEGKPVKRGRTASKNVRPRGIHAYDPDCPICSDTSGLRSTAAHEVSGEVPAPHPNPNPKGVDESITNYHTNKTSTSFVANPKNDGQTWYHGTDFKSSKKNPAPLQTLDEQGAKGSHWNAHLGTHFTSLHPVAKHFADDDYGYRQDAKNTTGGKEYARVAHAHLHMSNPKSYIDESHIDGHFKSYLQDQGFTHNEAQRATLGYPDESIRKHIHGFVDHLKSQGHDGLTYGNEEEGPHLHRCAIAFKSTPVTVHKWEWLGDKKQAAKHFAVEDYWMSHRPGGPGLDEEEGTAAPAHALDRVYPKDVYTHPHYYGTGEGLHGGPKAFEETVDTLRKIRGNPEAPVTMYRALPREHADGGFRTGDWVSVHPKYAEGHGLHPDDPSKDMPVIKATVPAKHLWNNGDSLDEFGYHGPPIKHEGFVKGGRKTLSSREEVSNLSKREESSMDRIAVMVHDGPMRITAHVSGNQIDILHCLAGETKYITPDGLKTLAETAGTEQKVLTADRGSRDARWVNTIIHEFPAQALKKINLRRNKMTKTIYATDEHRWLVTRPERFVTTADLLPGHRLQWATSSAALALAPSVSGIRHGIVFGDGYAHSNGKTAAVTLWGEKDKQLLKFFPAIDVKDRITPNGVAGLYLGGTKNGLHASMKGIPSFADSPEYILGWLAGYFAADGSVSAQGQAVICSSKLEHIEAVRDLAQSIGISTYSIVTKNRKGYGKSDSLLFSIQFIGSTVPESMFLIEQHRERFSLRDYGFERVGWTVVSVEKTDRFEPVYCPRVPGTESFVLEDNIHTGQCPFCGSGAVIGRSDGTVECGYCTTVFTVQTQPQYNGFPQSVNGQPYQWPGMPEPQGIAPADVPEGTNLNPNTNGEAGLPPGSEGSPGGGIQSSDPADDSEDEEDEDDESSDESGSDDDKKPNPFAKKKSYRTASGEWLDEANYLAHLAIAHAQDKKRVATLVKNARRG